MTGFAGDNPTVDLAADPVDSTLRFVRLLADAERGMAPRTACTTLVELALGDHGPIRTEAVQLLRERAVVRSALSAPERSALLSRAVGESENARLKDALASLCAELRMPGVIDALCMSIENEPDAAFAKTVGRLTKFVHGEGAVDVLRPQILRTRRAEVRDTLLLALGATGTEGALDALLNYRRVNGASRAIDAALEAHGTRRALAAVARKKQKQPAETPADDK